MRAVLIFLLLTTSASACADEPRATGPKPVKQSALNERGLTARQEAAYQQCLQDSMAVAMAWSAIEQSCLEQARGDEKPLSQ